MKKALLIILAITLLFTACNADATSGLFRTISEAREVISIKYEQILGKDSLGNLYFRTEKGIYSLEKDKSAPNAKLIVASKQNDIIQSAALVGNEILYTTNKSDSTFFVFDTPATVTLEEDYSLLRLLQNGQAILTKDGESDKYYHVTYPGNTISADSHITTTALTGYGLDGIFLPSNYKDSATNKKFVISFVNADSTYKNYIYDETTFPTTFHEFKSTIKGIANIAFDSSSNLFVLTRDGLLYYISKSGNYSGSAVTLADEALVYDRHDFFYPITNGSNLHFITNPSNTDSMTVFSVNFDDINEETTETNSIKAGYAAVLKDTKIVSSLQLDTPEQFLVATEKHGMYSVKVNPTKVNKNDSLNVDSISGAEEYTF